MVFQEHEQRKGDDLLASVRVIGRYCVISLCNYIGEIFREGCFVKLLVLKTSDGSDGCIVHMNRCMFTCKSMFLPKLAT